MSILDKLKTIDHKQTNEDSIFHFLLKFYYVLTLAILLLIYLTDHGVSSTEFFFEHWLISRRFKQIFNYRFSGCYR